MEEKDDFERNLDEQILILKDCQQRHNLISCFKCESMLGCETRKAYVDSVYLSMAKGKEGSFNFEAE